MKIEAFEACRLFHSLKLHFTRDSFDFFKSNGRIKISEKTFLAKKDRFAYYRLAKKYHREDLIDLIVSNILEKDSIWSMTLLEPEAEDVLNGYRKRIQSISYNFKEDIQKLVQWSEENKTTLDDILNPKDSYPPLLSMYMRREIQIETLIILNSILNFFPAWQRKIKDEIIWPKIHIKFQKYSPFVLSKIDIANMKKILKQEISS